MSANPIFELFEVLCTELSVRSPQTISEDQLDRGLLEDVMEELAETSEAVGFKKALSEIETHLRERGADMPFGIDFARREFSAIDAAYLDFVAFARNQRSVGGLESKDFEVRTLRRLRTRLTGDLVRVGIPRDRLPKRSQIVPVLVTLGFESTCFEPRDKDGGLDILWLPPIGAVPIRPVVSFQCKNSYFDEGEANRSTGRAERTLSRHTHLRRDHLKFVVFNDYIDQSFRGRATGWTFVPLGLTDLASPSGPGADDLL